MDCEQIKEILDAYALGAAEKAEAEALEEHVADCVRCWESLNEAQRATALLALSTAIEEASPYLRHRILDEARRQGRPSRGAGRLLAGLKRLWPAGVGVLAAAGVAALVLAVFVQAEMNDLQDENGQLERQVQEAGTLLGEQRQLMAVMAAPDLQQVSLHSPQPGSDALATYYWSLNTQSGFLVCNKLPPLAENQSYQVWILADGEAIPAGTFQPWKGIGQLPIDLSISDKRHTAIIVTIEDADGSDRPSGEPFLLASLESGE